VSLSLDEYYLSSERAFAEWNDHASHVNCLVALAKMMISKQDFAKAKSYAEKALMIAEREEFNSVEGNCRSILGMINDRIREDSKNSFVFLKAWPLYDANSDRPLGPITRIPSTFKSDVL